MNLNNCKIFCIYPEDKTTFFLDRIVSYLSENLGEAFHCFKVKLNQQSHQDCLSIINQLQNKFIIFLGHGRSDSLYGACGNFSEHLFASEEAKEGNPAFFKNTSFINITTSKVFAENIIFSFSCNSNERKNSIGVSSIANGAISFIGFGDIQTDYDSDKTLSKREMAIFKGLLVKIIKNSIFYSFSKNHNVERLVDTIKILTNKEIHELLTVHKKHRYSCNVSKNLYWFKEKIEIFGQKYSLIKN